MAKRTSFPSYSFSICLALLTGVLAAQQPTTARLEALPTERGVYFRTPSTWVALPTTVLAPLWHRGASNILGFGSPQAIAEMPGSRALIQTSNRRPTFYVQGFSPNAALYLVRSDRRPDHRELRMRVPSQVSDGPQFRSEDVQEIDRQVINVNLQSVQPRTDLAPGEYALVSVLEPGYRWIHVGFGFGVAGTTASR